MREGFKEGEGALALDRHLIPTAVLVGIPLWHTCRATPQFCFRDAAFRD